MRTSQSIASDTAAVDQDQQGELLLGTSVPTTENLAQLQQHHSAAEEDLIRAHPAASPRSTFWGEESRYTCKCPLARLCFCSCLAGPKHTGMLICAWASS